jgi:hypothetical protein
MRDLRPEGIPFEMAGMQYQLHFTLNVVDKIQVKFGKSISELTSILNEPIRNIGNARYILTQLINEGICIESDETGEKAKLLTEEYVGRHTYYARHAETLKAIYESFAAANCQTEDDGDPNLQSE